MEELNADNFESDCFFMAWKYASILSSDYNFCNSYISCKTVSAEMKG